MNEGFLPIGSVVILKDGEKRIMVTGFLMYADENKEKIYDYCGCLYPEGVVRQDKNLLFDKEQIDKVLFVGFRDDNESMDFHKNLSEIGDQTKSYNKEPEAKASEEIVDIGFGEI